MTISQYEFNLDRIGLSDVYKVIYVPAERCVGYLSYSQATGLWVLCDKRGNIKKKYPTQLLAFTSVLDRGHPYRYKLVVPQEEISKWSLAS